MVVVRPGKQHFVKLVADACENRRYRCGNADGDEAVLDRSRPGFVSNEAREGTHAPVSDRHNRKERSISQQLSVSVNGAFTSAKMAAPSQSFRFLRTRFPGRAGHL
jgi:hypothetical protein